MIKNVLWFSANLVWNFLVAAVIVSAFEAALAGTGSEAAPIGLVEQSGNASMIWFSAVYVGGWIVSTSVGWLRFFGEFIPFWLITSMLSD